MAVFLLEAVPEIRASEVHWARTSSSIAKPQTSTAVLTQTMLKPGYMFCLNCSVQYRLSLYAAHLCPYPCLFHNLLTVHRVPLS